MRLPEHATALPPRRPRRWARWTLGSLAALVGVPALVVAAWVACNGAWADADPQPVPAALLPQPVTLAPEDNAFFDLQGLRAPAGEAANAWGQRSWRGGDQSADRLLPLPSGDDWGCNPAKEDCVQRWRRGADGLQAQMANARLLGERCQALASRTAFQEPPPYRRATTAEASRDAAQVVQQFGGLTACVRWLQIEAILATDEPRARAAWGRSDALVRLVASGVQSLIGQAVTWAAATRQQQLLAQWAAQTAVGPPPAAWLAPLPARLLEPALWMATESALPRETVATMSAHGDQLFSEAPNALQAWLGRHRVGYQPQRTMQAFDAYWLADMQAVGHLQGAALAQRALSQPLADDSWWRFVRWRNTVGHILVEVGRPRFENFALRQADLALYQAALELSQQLNAVPAQDRAGWWQRQALDAALRERLTLQGDAVLVRTWHGEVDAAQAAPVRFPLRPA